jgi:hypothetical protein
MELKFECPTCGQHISATPAQIGVTAPCPHCSAAVTVPARQDNDQPVFVLPTKLPFLKSHRKKILEAKVSELVSLGPIDESIEAKLQDFAVALRLEKADADDAAGRWNSTCHVEAPAIQRRLKKHDYQLEENCRWSCIFRLCQNRKNTGKPDLFTMNAAQARFVLSLVGVLKEH